MKSDGQTYDDPAEAFLRGAQHFGGMWQDFAGKMAAAGMSTTPGKTTPDAAREMRDLFLKAMTESCDQYMRSDEFRQMMKQSMASAVELRRQFNEFLSRTQHEMQNVTRQDIDHVTGTVQHFEKRMLEHLEHLHQRLDEITDRLDTMDPASETTVEPAKRPAKPSAKRTKKPTARKAK